MPAEQIQRPPTADPLPDSSSVRPCMNKSSMKFVVAIRIAAIAISLH
jgi:hypothetical protein